MHNKRYYIINAFFALFVYLGTFQSLGWAMNTALFIAWVTSLTVILMSIGKVWSKALSQVRPNRIGRAIDFTFDMVIAIFFLKFGYIATAIIYCIQQAIITYEVSRWMRSKNILRD